LRVGDPNKPGAANGSSPAQSFHIESSALRHFDEARPFRKAGSISPDHAFVGPLP
jgi:hypothetical protein